MIVIDSTQVMKNSSFQNKDMQYTLVNATSLTIYFEEEDIIRLLDGYSSIDIMSISAEKAREVTKIILDALASNT